MLNQCLLSQWLVPVRQEKTETQGDVPLRSRCPRFAWPQGGAPPCPRGPRLRTKRGGEDPQLAPLPVWQTPPEAQGSYPGAHSVLCVAGKPSSTGTAKSLNSCPNPRGGPREAEESPPGLAAAGDVPARRPI